MANGTTPSDGGLKEEVLFSVLQFFGDECRIVFDKSGRDKLRELLGQTLWAAIEKKTLTWEVRDQKYVRKIVKKIADDICDDLDDERDRITGDVLEKHARPRLLEAKAKGDEKLARFKKRFDGGADDLGEEVAQLAMWTKYCDGYS